MTQVRKLQLKKRTFSLTVEKLLQEIQDNMLAKAKAILQEKTSSVQNYEEFKKVLDEKGGFIKAAWCGSPDCEAKVKDETGATIRIRPFQIEQPTTHCIVCEEKAKETAYFARSY